MTPKELRDLATERRAKLGNKETRLSKALDEAADEIELLRKVIGSAKIALQNRKSPTAEQFAIAGLADIADALD